MDHIWNALDAWADKLGVKLGLLCNEEECRKLDADDRDAKSRDENVTEFTRLRNQQDLLGAAKAAAA
ncbi:hypothetical protein [Arthrobacter sp. CP30]